MASRSFLSKLTVMAVVATLCMGVVMCQTGTNPLCNSAKWKELCTSMVKGATNWQSAVENSIQSTIEATKGIEENMIPIVETAFANLPKNSLTSGVAACKGDFTRITGDLNTALTALAKKDNNTVDYKLRGGLYLGNCNMAFTDFHVPPPPKFRTLFDQFNQHVHSCVAVFHQVPPESLRGSLSFRNKE